MENEVTLDAKTLHWEREAIEKLLLADVRERRATRRWRIFRSLIWMALFGTLVWFLVSGTQLSGATAVPHTAMVAIKGEISDAGEGSADASRDEGEEREIDRAQTRPQGGQRCAQQGRDQHRRGTDPRDRIERNTERFGHHEGDQ